MEHTKTITVLWPPTTKPATVQGKYRRLPDGTIEATYTVQELALCLACMGLTEAEKQAIWPSEPWTTNTKSRQQGR
jgi:hypothetical protein